MTQTQTSSKRYYHLWAKKYVGQWCGEDLTLYETGVEMWLNEEELLLKILAGTRLVEADIADLNQKRYTDWLED